MAAISRRGKNLIDVFCILFFTAIFFIPVTGFIDELIHQAHPSRIHESGEWLRPRWDWGYGFFFLIILVFVFIEESVAGTSWPVFRGTLKRSGTALAILIGVSSAIGFFLMSGGNPLSMIMPFGQALFGLACVVGWLALPLIFCYVVRTLMLRASWFLYEMGIFALAMVVLLWATYMFADLHGTGDGETQIVIFLTVQPVALALVVGTARDLVMRKVVEPMVGEDAGEGMAGSA